MTPEQEAAARKLDDLMTKYDEASIIWAVTSENQKRAWKEKEDAWYEKERARLAFCNAMDIKFEEML